MLPVPRSHTHTHTHTHTYTQHTQHTQHTRTNLIQRARESSLVAGNVQRCCTKGGVRVAFGRTLQHRLPEDVFGLLWDCRVEALGTHTHDASSNTNARQNSTQIQRGCYPQEGTTEGCYQRPLEHTRAGGPACIFTDSTASPMKCIRQQPSSNIK